MQKGKIFGDIRLSDKFLQINPFEKDKNILVTFDNNQLVQNTCGSTNTAIFCWGATEK